MFEFVKRLLPARASAPVVLLFLDVDGVLNSQATREDGDHLPAPMLLDNLARIVECTGTQIVLSSTWREREHTLRAVELALASRQLTLLSSTPDLTTTGDRVDEILQWMQQPELAVEAWIALDDMNLMKMNSKLDAAHFVRTDDAVGLTRDKAEEAITKLLAQRNAKAASAQ